METPSSKLHGMLGPNGTRWCEVCGRAHGLLYACEHYSLDTLWEISEAEDRYRMWLQSEAAEESTPSDVLAIFRALAGL